MSGSFVADSARLTPMDTTALGFNRVEGQREQDGLQMHSHHVLESWVRSIGNLEGKPGRGSSKETLKLNLLLRPAAQGAGLEPELEQVLEKLHHHNDDRPGLRWISSPKAQFPKMFQSCSLAWTIAQRPSPYNNTLQYHVNRPPSQNSEKQHPYCNITSA